MDATELNSILQLAVLAPIGSYADALQARPLFDKFVRLHNMVAQGGRLEVLNAKEAALVDAMRRGMACIAPGNAGPAAQADGIVTPGSAPSEVQLSALEG